MEVNITKETTEKFWHWFNEVGDAVSNILLFATEEERHHLMLDCNGKASERGWAEYVCNNMPELAERIVRATES